MSGVKVIVRASSYERIMEATRIAVRVVGEYPDSDLIAVKREDVVFWARRLKSGTITVTEQTT